MRRLERAAEAGFNHGGKDFWKLLSDEDRAEYTRMLRASLEWLADEPDDLTVIGMVKDERGESRVRKAWHRLVMGLVQADKAHD